MTTTKYLTATEKPSGSICGVDGGYDSMLNDTSWQYNLQVILLPPPYQRTNSTAVLSSLNLTEQKLNSAYLSIVSGVKFREMVVGHTWALQYWGPEVPSYTPPSNLTRTGNYWAIPSDYKASGVFFVFGLWNNSDGSAYGTIYATYSLGNQNTTVDFVNKGPFGCATT